jgi:hypothetical protein
MSELVEAIASPWNLVLVVIGFGFLPGFALRSLLKVYPRDDPRRRELIAQLYALKRIERPFFVAEQLETVMFEGVPARLRHGWRSVKGTSQRRRPAATNKWSEIFPQGRHIFYEGDNPRKFAEQIKAEFEFDVTKDPRWENRDPGFTTWSFDCPPELLDKIYGSDRFPMGS